MSFHVLYVQLISATQRILPILNGVKRRRSRSETEFRMGRANSTTFVLQNDKKQILPAHPGAKIQN